MMHRLTVSSLLAVALVLGACRRQAPEDPTPPPPPPAQPTQPGAGAGAGAGGEDAAAAAQAETARALAILEERIHFDYDRDNIRADAEPILMRKIPILRANPQVRLRIEGHADERGSSEYNQALAQRRAQAARDFLVGYGVEGSRLEVVSFGEDRPLDSRSTEAAWALNRRAEFRVTAGGDRLTIPVSQ